MLLSSSYLADFTFNFLVFQSPGRLNKAPVFAKARLGQCPPKFALFEQDIPNNRDEKVRWPFLPRQQHGLSVRYSFQSLGPAGSELT